MTMFYNVPSSTPMTKRQAYRAAVERFGVDDATARQAHDGIVYQGPHGTTVYAEWKDLPAPKK